MNRSRNDGLLVIRTEAIRTLRGIRKNLPSSKPPESWGHPGSKWDITVDVQGLRLGDLILSHSACTPGSWHGSGPPWTPTVQLHLGCALSPLTAEVTFYWGHEWDPGVPAKPVIRNLLCLAGLEEKPCYLSSPWSWGILDLWPWCSKRYLTQTDDPQEGIVNPDSIDSTFISPPRVSRILETQVALNSVSRLLIAREHAYLSEFWYVTVVRALTPCLRPKHVGISCESPMCCFGCRKFLI